MLASNARCKHLYVETACASTYRCFLFQVWYLLVDVFSSTIRAANLSATTCSYRNSHTLRLRFYFPPACFTCSRLSTSAKPTRTPTIVSAAKRGGGGSHSRSATINSTVLNRFFRCAS